MGSFMKKIVATALCLFVGVESFTGCGTSGHVSEMKHYTVFIGDSTDEPARDNRILKRFRDELGYDFEFEYLNSGLEDRLDVMISTGDYPDLVFGDSKLISAGALLPLDKYITEEKTPNLYNHIAPVRKKIQSSDGHIYIIPNYGRFYGDKQYNEYEGPAFWIQARVLEEAGYPEIKTIDEFFELVENYVHRHPETDGMPTIGYEILSAAEHEYIMTSPPAYLAGSPNNGPVIVDESTATADIYADSDYTNKYLNMIRTLNSKGLVDQEGFTQSFDQYLAKIASGRVVAMFDQGWDFNVAVSKLAEQGKYDKTYIPLGPVFSEEFEPWYMDDGVINAGSGFGISISCTDPEGLVEFMDTILSEEWQKYIRWGIEGEDYLVDKNGKFYQTPEMREKRKNELNKKKTQISAFDGMLPKIEGEYSDGNGAGPVYQFEEYYEALSDYEREIYSHYDAKTIRDFLNPRRENPKYYPVWQIDLIEGSDADRADHIMTELEMEYFPQMMIAASDEEFNSLWKEYVQRLHSEVDIEAYLKRINEQIQWRMKNW